MLFITGYALWTPITRLFVYVRSAEIAKRNYINSKVATFAMFWKLYTVQRIQLYPYKISTLPSCCTCQQSSLRSNQENFRQRILRTTMLTFLAGILCLGLSHGAGNPYAGKTVYVQQAYVQEVQGTINKHPDQADLLKKFQNVPVFYWLDSISRIANLTTVMDGALAQANNGSQEIVVQIIIYNVPDRDCSAAASNGEIACMPTSIYPHIRVECHQQIHAFT